MSLPWLYFSLPAVVRQAHHDTRFAIRHPRAVVRQAHHDNPFFDTQFLTAPS